MDAPTLEAMEQLNRMGKSFWRINVGKSAGPQTRNSTRNLTNTSRCSPRTASADRWLNVQNQSPVNDPPNADRLRSRPRDPRTSTKNHTIFRGRACSLGGSIVDRGRGSSSDKITNGSSYSNLPYSGFQSVSSSPRPQHDVTKCSGEWFTPQRTTATQNGVYEDQQSEFWRSLKSNSNDDSNVAHRQGGNCVNLTYNSSDSSGTRSRHLDLPHYEREAEEERCKLWPTPPPYSPSVLTVNSLRNSDLQSQDYNGHGIDRAGGGKENTKRPILATLDEHLKSLEKQDQKENAIQERSPLKLHGKKAVNHQAPCWRKTTHDKWLLEQRVQTNGGFVNSEPSNSVTASETKCIEKGVAVTINDSYNAKIHNGLQTSDHPAIQLPSPKTVGKVFVMEAATYSNDDYELLSESMSGPRPHLAPMLNSFQRLGAKEEWPTERETSQSGCINEVPLVGSCRLRRAHTTRDSCRKAVPETDSAERDGEDVKRRYAVFLDDVNGWRKSSEEIGSRNPGLNDEFLNDSNPPGKLWRTNPVLHLSDKESIPVVDPSASQPSSLPSIGTRAYRQKLVNLEAKQLPWHVDHIHDSVGDALAVKDQPLSNPGSTPLAPSSHPPSTVSSSAVSEPPIPRSRRTLASASIRSTQSEKQDVNTDPSPSTSSRASTVFCTPWDAPPTGVYLSDLIQLTGGGVANANRREPPSHLRRRTLSSLDHRLFSGRPASIGDLGQHNSKLEFQRLLWLWMQHNTVTDGKPTPMQPRNQGGSEDLTTNGPPPVPQRRPRLKHLQTSLSTTATPRSARSDESADINPYAVVTCSTDATPDDDSFAGSGKATSKQLLQDVKVLNADEGEPTGVYDDTFVEHADGPIGKVNLIQLDAAPSSKCGAFPDGSNTLVGTGDGSAPRNYVCDLMREKSSPLANQINLFLECTRNSVNQGPYRTMQSVRQFISGITNYLLQNPKLGLPSAIELEKRQLSDFGFVNVGALLESSLQKYVLRPLHRHIIRQLRQEQIRHNELGPLQNTVQWLGATSPQEFGIPSSLRVPTEPLLQRVRALFRQVQSTYSVSRKMSHLVHLFDLIRDEASVSCRDSAILLCESIDRHRAMQIRAPSVAGALQPC
ncbi:unnamed protein product [Dicrocoelium dendriticum]|nr:unnamed protein product [Dicrocoelium dendriticum]